MLKKIRKAISNNLVVSTARAIIKKAINLGIDRILPKSATTVAKIIADVAVDNAGAEYDSTNPYKVQKQLALGIVDLGAQTVGGAALGKPGAYLASFAVAPVAEQAIHMAEQHKRKQDFISYFESHKDSKTRFELTEVDNGFTLMSDTSAKSASKLTV